jgi:hypothetical protein
MRAALVAAGSEQQAGKQAGQQVSRTGHSIRNDGARRPQAVRT